jgi:hypothetical protein
MYSKVDWRKIQQLVRQSSYKRYLHHRQRRNFLQYYCIRVRVIGMFDDCYLSDT